MDMKSKLTSLGFTEYEAKVYLALLKESPATGYQISKNSGVPRSMVYEALGRLFTRGAVLRSDEKHASQYRPVPPEVLLDRIEREHRELSHSLREGLNNIYRSQEEDLIWTIHGQGSVLAYAVQMIQRAQNDIFVLLTDADIQELEDTIASSFQRGVNVNALLTGSSSFNESSFVGKVSYQAAHPPPMESELQELSDMLVVTIDGSECLIANDETGLGNSSGEKGAGYSATVTNNRNLVFITQQFIWMELFAQRMRTRLGSDLLEKLDVRDRRILENLHPFEPQTKGN